MVRQSEIAKSRRTNMANSSINAPAKKGGAGGSFVWGAAKDIVDYEATGFDVDTVGILAAPAPVNAPIIADQLAHSLNLEDKQEFPALMALPITPEKVSKPLSEDALAQVDAVEKVTEDWIVVPTAEITAAKNINDKSNSDAYDSQHPRSMLCKKTQARRAKSTERRKMPELGIDWSQEGMPTEVKKQIIHASMTSSHRGPYGKEQCDPVPLSVLRTQNRRSSSQRQNSTPRTPRSQSKPRVIQQPSGRR